MKLILASKSERRIKLLNEIGLPFEVIVSDVEEVADGVYYSDIPLINACSKSRSVAERFPESLVIGADTVIEFNRQIIGKPRDLTDARNILLSLSGKTHSVVTAVCLLSLHAGIRCTFFETTTVRFKSVTGDAVDQYLSNVHVLDKAGAYAIQEYGEMLVESINGPLDNVVGLPCAKLAAALNACGFSQLTA